MERVYLNEKTRSKRRDWKWSDLNEARANDVIDIYERFRKYCPLTVRAFFYRLLSGQYLRGGHWHKYGKANKPLIGDLAGTLSSLLKWMRIDGKLSWDAITDETRILTVKRGFDSAKDFLKYQSDRFLRGYSRCVAQDQQYHIEVWLEKQTLLHIVEPVADEFCRRVLCCRGYDSVTFQADFYSRTSYAIQQGLKPVVLYFGDHDPSGINMFHAAIQTIHDEFGLDEDSVIYQRCGILPEQFNQLTANPDPLPVKEKDTRTKNFVKQYGPTCYELDAFEPEQLQQLVRESIAQFTDMDAVICNLEIENDERSELEEIREQVLHVVNDHI